MSFIVVSSIILAVALSYCIYEAVSEASNFEERVSASSRRHRPPLNVNQDRQQSRVQHDERLLVQPKRISAVPDQQQIKFPDYGTLRAHPKRTLTAPDQHPLQKKSKQWCILWIKRRHDCSEDLLKNSDLDEGAYDHPALITRKSLRGQPQHALVCVVS